VARGSAVRLQEDAAGADGRSIGSDSVIVLSLLLAAALTGGIAHAGAADVKVLFIGNSLTAANDLPAMIANVAAAERMPPLVWKAVLRPGASLEDHWEAGEARRAIRSQRWDFVVLQQGPSALPESRRLLRRDTALFAREIRAAGARPALYMVWPSRARAFDFDAVSSSYRSAAQDVDGLIIPAGEAWRAAWKRDPSAELYSTDGFHPSPKGSYLAALVFFQALYGRSPLGLPAVDLRPEEARLFQEAAAEAGRRFARR
jgi:hypothetical protein